MSRRARLPGADELFRATGGPTSGAAAAAEVRKLVPAPEPAQDSAGYDAGGYDAGADEGSVERPGLSPVRQTRITRRSERRPSGRERHEEKITVYCSGSELIDLEHARLALRGEYGLAVDRGRIVREAIAFIIADLDAKGEASILVRRLRGR